MDVDTNRGIHKHKDRLKELGIYRYIKTGKNADSRGCSTGRYLVLRSGNDSVYLFLLFICFFCLHSILYSIFVLSIYLSLYIFLLLNSAVLSRQSLLCNHFSIPVTHREKVVLFTFLHCSFFG